MKLRLRLALTLAVLVVPFAVGLAFYQVSARARALDEGIARGVLDRMESGAAEACEAAPASWPLAMRRGRRRRGPGRPGGPLGPAGSVFAYDASFASQNPSAPPFDAELREALAGGDQHAGRDIPGLDMRRVAVRMPWTDGPCAIVVAQTRVPSVSLVQALTAPLLVSLFAVLMAVLAAGPVVRRTRRLTDAVRRASGGEDRSVALPGRDEIAELSEVFETNRRKLRDQVARLKERDEALTRYIANTTHDVMLPLTVLSGHLASMHKRLGRGEPVDPGLVRDAIEESHYLASLVQNLSAAAKLDSGEAPPRTDAVDMNELVGRVVGRHRTVARQRDISLDSAVPEKRVMVKGDVTLIEQAVNNVVHNAVRYNREDGHVVVLLEEAPDDRFRLRVIDDGPGIPPDELERITERRFRGNEARTRHPDGMGLGLHIAHDVAEKHGFDFTLRPSEHGGLEVELGGRRARETAETQSRRD